MSGMTRILSLRSAIIASTVLTLVMLNAWGMGLLPESESPLESPAASASDLAVMVDSQSAAVSDEWPELVESLFSHQPGEKSFGYAQARRVDADPELRMDGSEVLPADFEEVRQFLLDNCFEEECSAVESLQENYKYSDSARLTGLAARLAAE